MGRSRSRKSRFAKMLSVLRSGRRLPHSFVNVFRFLSARSSYGQSQLTLPKKLTWLSYLNPWYWVLWSVDFLIRWIATRPTTRIVVAVPALLGLAAVSILFIERYVRGSVHRKSTYLQRLLASEKAEKWDAALLHAQVLSDMSPENLDWFFESAAIKERLGNEEEANATMKILADTYGSARAAYWLATHSFDLNKLPTWTAEDHAQFRKCMKIALESPESVGMEQRKMTMAKYMLGTANPADALAYITPLVPEFPELALSAAIIHKSLGNISESKRFAATATSYLEAELDANVESAPIRTSLVASLILQEREEEAFQSLESGYQLSKNPSLLAMQSEPLLLWAQRLKREGRDEQTLLQRLTLISKAVEIAPNQNSVMESLFEIAMECRNSQNASIRSLLPTTLKGANPGVLHFVRGTIATLDGDFEKAEKYLSLAAQGGKPMPGVLNNLAIAISGKKDGNQEQALRCAEMALSQMPNHPYLLETRGQILAKLNRPNEAIRDLEVAIQTEELKSGALPTLVECYKKIGLPEMEQHFRKMIKE